MAGDWLTRTKTDLTASQYMTVMCTEIIEILPNTRKLGVILGQSQ